MRLTKPYSKKELAKQLSHPKLTSVSTVEEKNVFAYLSEFLGPEGLKAKTIVIEDNYISKDYLIDYAFYYSFCFDEYGKKCKRLHFFSSQFSDGAFESVIVKKPSENDDFWNKYLGFIVVKPIPHTMIGMTLLKHYPEVQGRYFWGKRTFSVHVFGNEIKLDSLAFQEQDSVVAACASTAVWSMLSKAAMIYNTPLKSPSEITKYAGAISSDGGRLFPNKNGLDIVQLCQAIYELGFVTELGQPDIIKSTKKLNDEQMFFSHTYLKKLLNAYSEIGIPLILIINVPDVYNVYDLHAITISGYKKMPHKDIRKKGTLTWSAEFIEKFYAHDDQWGPFSRVEFKNKHDLISPWTKVNPKKLPSLAYQLIIPLYHKIRISYDEIEFLTLAFDAILYEVIGDFLKFNFIWDIKLQLSEKFKENIKDSPLSDSYKLKELTRNYPKYIWVASCYIGELKIFDFVFDATDISNAMIGFTIVKYVSEEINDYILEYIKLNPESIEEYFDNHQYHLYYEFMLGEFKV